MRATGWEERYLLLYGHFYYNLDNHHWRQIQDGEASLIRLHDQQRRAWHNYLTDIIEGRVTGDVWNLAEISLSKLEQVMSEIRAERETKLQDQVSKPSPTRIVGNTNQDFPPLIDSN